MIQAKHETIGDHNWTCVQFSGTKTLDVIHAVYAAVGPSIAALAGAEKRDVSAAELMLAATQLVRQMPQSSDLKGLVFMLLANTHVDGQPMSKDVFDDVFAGTGIRELPAAIAFVIRSNYGDFSQAVALARGIIHPSPEAPAAPTTPPAS